MKSILLSVSVLLFFGSCKKMFLYHPDEVRPDARNLNATNIARIEKLPVKSTFKFILVGDTQRFYDELDAFVSHVNGRSDISFILLDGDLTDFGLNMEFNLIAEKLGRLEIPYVSAIGNHDKLANGTRIFQEMFGPENFSFAFGGSKFIGINTNSQEAGFDGTVPDLNWLKNEVDHDGDAENLFVFSHVAPYSSDFDRTLEAGYTAILRSNPNTRISLP